MYIVVNEQGKFYTNDQRKFAGARPFLWSSHKRLAKRYAKRGWADKIAKKNNGVAKPAV